MNPALIIFGIQSIVRLGKVTNDATEQWARDGEALFPPIQPLRLNQVEEITKFFSKEENAKLVLGTKAPYRDCWIQDNDNPKQDEVSIDTLTMVMVKIVGNKVENGEPGAGQRAGASWMIRQWNKESEPVSPFARIILTGADIVLEYISINPSILGGSGNGEKLLGAYSGSLSELIPNDAEFGPKQGFAERLGAVFLRAGLQTLQDHPDWVVKENHLKELLNNTIDPLLKKFPGEDITQQLRWDTVKETLMGPVAVAALKTIAKHQTTFLGDNFDQDKALGAVTQALFLKTVEDDNLVNQLGKDGLIELYQATLNVVAERPQLFLADLDDDQPTGKLATNLLVNIATVLKDAPPPFNKEIGIKLASTAITVIGTNAHNFARTDKPWEEVASDIVTYLSNELAQSLENNGNLKNVLTNQDLIEVGRIVLEHVAETPGIILKTDSEAWKEVVKAVALAMKSDEKLLLSGSDWQKLIAVVVEQAAINPGRLFKLKGTNDNEVIAGELLSIALQASAKLLTERLDLQGKSILFGDTLRQMLVILLKNSSGSPDKVKTLMHAIEQLIIDLHLVVAENAIHYGSREYLIVFEYILVGAMRGDKVIPSPISVDIFSAKLEQAGV